MECKGSGEIRNETEKKRFVPVDCEICDSTDEIECSGAGVYICAACHRDIVSLHIHD